MKSFLKLFGKFDYGKGKENRKATPDKYREKVSIDIDFHGAMKLLAHHANTKGTTKITYEKRNRVKK